MYIYIYMCNTYIYTQCLIPNIYIFIDIDIDMTYLMQVYGVYHCWFNQHFDLCMILMGSARVW